MKIGIDISPIVYGTGVSVYTKNLVENLVKLDTQNQFVLFGGSLRRSMELKDFIYSLNKKNVIGKVYPLAPTLADILWNRLHILPVENFTGKLDVFHSSDWTQPPTKAFKVTTIHDLSPILYPKLTDPKIVSAHMRRLSWVKKEADRVIVPSQTTASDTAALGIPSEKIRVIPEAIEPGMKRSSNLKIIALKQKYRISGKYLLAVGVNLRKNTPNIIKAFERIKTELGYKLVIIGHKYTEFKGERGVVFTGFIPNSELATFYSGAEVLIYPSIYEGFGLPILYAFSCKTPVVTSNIGSMAEIAGDAAILVEPSNPEKIAEGVLEALKKRENLVKSGLVEAGKYSWQKSAQDTYKVYSEAAQ